MNAFLPAIASLRRCRALAEQEPIPTRDRSGRSVGCALALLFFWVIWVPRLVSVEPVFPVTITTQPRSITVPISSTGVFSVVTNGNVFQWRHNGQPIPGATSATLTIANVQSGDAGSYDVVVTGSGTITSTAAVLSIGQPIQFVVQPRDASIAVGSRAAFCIDVTGDGPFTYQWQSITVRAVTSKIDDGITYQGTTTATLVVGPAPFAGGRTQLFCEVTDIHGSPVNSRTAQLLTGNLQCLTITTLAGGSPGNTDGHGTAARFNQPSGIAADAWGNLYVADFYNNTIRKVNPTGDVTTLAGLAGSSGSADGFGSTARFYGPCGITADASGNLFVTDFYNNTIRKVSSVGVVTTVAGLAGSQGSTDGFGSTAQFYMPNGIANDSAGNLYVTDMGNSTVRKITPVGVVTTVAGLAGSRGSADGFGSAALFNNPIGISVDVVGNLYVADSGNCTIREITPAGMVTTFAGFAGSSGNADGTGNTVRFTAPSGIASDVAGDLYVIDENSVREVSTTGVVTTVAGQAGIAFGNTDGIGSVAQFYSPFGIAVDATGSVFIADNHNNLIRKGVPTTLTARLGSLSARGLAGAGDQTLIAGFATSGDGNKQLLLRGIGPSLAPFGVSSVVADPALTLFNVAGTVLQQNNDWGGTAALTSAFTQVGAFSLPANSKDAALLATLPSGVYTAHLTAQGGTGVALVEAYDADPGTPTARLASLSARDQLGIGDNILIAGFVITGNVSRTVLIRGIGPTLARYGVSGALANPQLQVFQSNTLLAQNDDWGGDTTVAAVAAQVYAFALDANSKDAALLLTLPPGAYTAQVSGVGNTTGVALVEIYEVP